MRRWWCEVVKGYEEECRGDGSACEEGDVVGVVRVPPAGDDVVALFLDGEVRGLNLLQERLLGVELYQWPFLRGRAEEALRTFSSRKAATSSMKTLKSPKKRLFFSRRSTSVRSSFSCDSNSARSRSKWSRAEASILCDALRDARAALRRDETPTREGRVEESGTINVRALALECRSCEGRRFVLGAGLYARLLDAACFARISLPSFTQRPK